MWDEARRGIDGGWGRVSASHLEVEGEADAQTRSTVFQMLGSHPIHE